MTHELNFKQWHHGYLGMILLAVALWVENLFIGLIGWYILVDDLLQHFIQWMYDDSYQSPLKFLYARWIWKPLHKKES